MRNEKYKYLWLVSVMIIISISCSTINRINKAKQTVQAIASQAQGLATEGSDLLKTAEASGPLQTAQAYATQEIPGLLKTAEAFATSHPDLIETGWAVATQVAQGASPNEPPSDIPILPQEQIDHLYGTREMVSYFTKIPILKVVEFYKTEMLNNGWESISNGTSVTQSIAVLNYEKIDQTAQIVITLNPIENNTSVLITIQQR